MISLRKRWTVSPIGIISDLDKYIVGEMCINASKGVKLQCEREYWAKSADDVRDTQLHKLTSSERKHLLTNNLNTERYLARFGSLAAQPAQKSNKLFKAKRIRDDLKPLMRWNISGQPCNTKRKFS